jgi:uncharacterized protein (DUF1684 family)
MVPALCLFMHILLSAGCTRNREEGGSEEAAYVKSIDRWHRDRIERLTSPNGWLSVAGLYWLEGGRHSVGSDPSNDIVFPKGKAPAFVGAITVTDDGVRFDARPGVDVIHDGRPVETMMLEDDGGGEPTRLELGTLTWYLIRRGERLGIRLKDSRNPLITEFKGIERYPVSSSWRIEAAFEPFPKAKTVPIQSVIGVTTNEPCPGSLVFEVGGVACRLDPITESGSEQWFIIFADETTGNETYGGGRFLYVEPPDESGKVVIDFNKAYNPPCAFNEFTTCPLPPRQNILPVRVTAGEKAYAGGPRR